jgi:hypothetical protein
MCFRLRHILAGQIVRYDKTYFLYQAGVKRFQNAHCSPKKAQFITFRGITEKYGYCYIGIEDIMVQKGEEVAVPIMVNNSHRVLPLVE